MRSIFVVFMGISVIGYSQNKGTIHLKKQSEEKRLPSIIEPVVITAPLTIVEKMPSYPGGNQALYSYISTLKYPKRAVEEGISGTCCVTFIVDTAGALQDIKVLRGVRNCRECDSTALDLGKKMPNWIPGQQSGRKVNVQFNLPIKFSVK
jgi:protein TonB